MSFEVTSAGAMLRDIRKWLGILVAAHAHVAEAVQHFLLVQDAVGVDQVFDQLGIVRERRRLRLRSRARRGKNDRQSKVPRRLRRGRRFSIPTYCSLHKARRFRISRRFFDGHKMLYGFADCTKCAAMI